MLELALALKSLIFSPWVCSFYFIAWGVIQFYMAQKLHHHRAWFAFIPGLQQVQWFQMGHVSVWFLLTLVPFILLWFVPVIGPTNLQIVIITIKALLGAQLVLILLVIWFKATLHIVARAGERPTYSVWFLLPIVNFIALARIAFRKTYWLKDKNEITVVNKIIEGLEGDKTVASLKKYLDGHGYNAQQFEVLADKALTIEINDLEASYTKYAIPFYLNLIGIAFIGLFAGVMTNTLLQNYAVFFSSSAAPVPTIETQVQSNKDGKLEAPRVQVKKVEEKIVGAPKEFVFLMSVKDFKPKNENMVFEGALQSGTSISRSAKTFYLLDKNFKLLDSVNVNSVSGLFGQFSVEVQNIVDPELVSYIAETQTLRSLNNLDQSEDSQVKGVPFIVITNNDGDSKSQNREVLVNIKRDQLRKSDNLYVYNKSLKLVNAAEIIYLIDPSRNSLDSLKPTNGAELVLEFAREFTGQELYLSTLKDLAPLKDYIEILNL